MGVETYVEGDGKTWYRCPERLQFKTLMDDVIEDG